MGAVRAVPADVRVVSATHRELDPAAERGDFRSDLLGRLSGVRLRLLPVRERREDLGLLVSALLRRLGAHEDLRLSLPAARTLFQRRWPHQPGGCASRGGGAAPGPA